MSKLHPIAKQHGYSSNEKFYKDYPTEASYKKAMGGDSGAPYNGQPTAKEFYNFGYIPSGPKFFYEDGGNTKNYLDQFKPKTEKAKPLVYDGEAQDEFLAKKRDMFKNLLAGNTAAALHNEVVESILNPQEEANPFENEAMEYAAYGSAGRRRNPLSYFGRNSGWSYPGESNGYPGVMNSNVGYNSKYTGSDLKNIDFSNIDARGVKVDVHKAGLLNRLGIAGPKSYSVSFGNEFGPRDNSNPAKFTPTNYDVQSNQPHDFDFANPARPGMTPSNNNQGNRPIYNPNLLTPFTTTLPITAPSYNSNANIYNQHASGKPGYVGPNGMGNPFSLYHQSNQPDDPENGTDMNQLYFPNFANPQSGPLATPEYAYGGYLPKAQYGAFDGPYGLNNQNVPSFPGAPVDQTMLNPDQVVQPNMAMSGNMENGQWTPNASTASGRFDFNRQMNLSGETKANMLLAGTAGAANFFGMDEQRAYEKKLASMSGADQQFYANTQHNRGTWSDGAQGPNINFRPNQHNPVQFTGQAPTDYNSWMAAHGGQKPCMNCGGYMEVGGEVEMTDEELQNFLAQGGQVEYL